MSIEDLAQSELWWYGPEKLQDVNEVLVKIEIEKSTEVHEEKVIQILMMSNIIQSDTQVLWRLTPKRHSSWKSRICGWVIRFITNARRLADRKITGELLPSEVKDADDWFIKSAQTECFKEDYRLLKKGKSISSGSKLISLQPSMDEYGLMRCNSRIVNVEYLPIETRYPVILARIS